MPPPKSTAGYTKAAQKIKYVRNRDIKLTGKEMKDEERIQKGMSEGICTRCREKIQWRFQFNKYKPLKNLANCQGCKRKCITKAYRTLCDECANNKNVCPSCCQDFAILSAERKERDKYLGVNDEDNNNSGNNDGNDDRKISSNEDDMEEVSGRENQDHDEEGDDEDQEGDGDEEDNENEDQEEEGEDNMEQEPGTKRGFQQNSNEQTPSTVFTGSLNDWNARKFDDIVANKYSKARVTGSSEDNLQNGVVVSFQQNESNNINNNSSI